MDTLQLQVGKTYLDASGTYVTIVACHEPDDSTPEMRFLSQNRDRFHIDGRVFPYTDLVPNWTDLVSEVRIADESQEPKQSFRYEPKTKIPLFSFHSKVSQGRVRVGETYQTQKGLTVVIIRDIHTLDPDVKPDTYRFLGDNGLSYNQFGQPSPLTDMPDDCLIIPPEPHFVTEPGTDRDEKAYSANDVDQMVGDINLKLDERSADLRKIIYGGFALFAVIGGIIAKAVL